MNDLTKPHRSLERSVVSQTRGDQNYMIDRLTGEAHLWTQFQRSITNFDLKTWAARTIGCVSDLANGTIKTTDSIECMIGLSRRMVQLFFRFGCLAVREFIAMFGSEGSFIFIECFSDVKPVFHIQSASQIISDNAHYPTEPNASVTYASEIIYSQAFMLEAMIRTIANDISVTIVFADSEALATYLVTEASKLDHAPYLSGSGKLMELMMRRAGGT
ncbi:uncharacterized protein EDB91DRAFT_1146942 [Suillus paluster]|uniref:uncharacterized protein n=1 Tax=Suillus paluster TaxID=48578 RepID=UPI001B87AC50|nr:uncharacterized protein EDB91DRAFT_1146942 [Suillus paluster]KAG1734446.1 hypothetical protein EDB91DRAFT_1146942 [Suillus paluster]